MEILFSCNFVTIWPFILICTVHITLNILTSKKEQRYTLFFYKKPVYKKPGLKFMWYYNIFFCSIVNLNNRKQKKI